jgi:hypothetical protein
MRLKRRDTEKIGKPSTSAMQNFDNGLKNALGLNK